MKRFAVLLFCVSLLLVPQALAQEAPEPMKLAEIEQFNQALLERAIKEELPPFAAEGGFVVRGVDYELLLAGEDVSGDSLVISAALLGLGQEEEGGEPAGPRTSVPGMKAEDLIALYPNDNPYLAGRQDSAALYIAGELPAAVSTGFLLRDGQALQLVEYDVYYQAGEGVVRTGIQYTVEQGFVTAVRSFISMEPLSQQAAADELANLRALQEQNEYIAFGDRDGSRLTREDLVLSGLDFFDADYEAAVNVLGAPSNEERLDDSDGGKLIICQWPGMEAVFTQAEGTQRAQRLTVNGGTYEGPRGLRLGDTLAQAISRFEHAGELRDNGSALYGDALNQVPPYGLMVTGTESTLLYYAIDAQAGKAGLIMEFVDDLMVSMTLTYL